MAVCSVGTLRRLAAVLEFWPTLAKPRVHYKHTQSPDPCMGLSRPVASARLPLPGAALRLLRWLLRGLARRRTPRLLPFHRSAQRVHEVNDVRWCRGFGLFRWRLRSSCRAKWSNLPSTSLRPKPGTSNRPTLGFFAVNSGSRDQARWFPVHLSQRPIPAALLGRGPRKRGRLG
jgi:hypothetical protein